MMLSMKVLVAFFLMSGVAHAQSVYETWSGQTGQGKPITLIVSRDRITSIHFHGAVPGQYCSPDFDFGISVNEQIANGRIGFDGQSSREPVRVKFSIAGSFTSDTAEGSLDMTIVPLPSGPSCSGSAQTTWTVQRSGAPEPTQKHIVFLIHGIAQTPADLNSLATNLQEGLGPDYIVDLGFDYSDCANNVSCSGNCTIGFQAQRLADYIKKKSPAGDIALVGYSLGGIVARDLVLNNYFDVLGPTRRVGVLVTLGTPNLGYPYIPEDNNARCSVLASEMFGDFRNTPNVLPQCGKEVSCVDLKDSVGHRMTISSYLAGLNGNWSQSPLANGPERWLAVAGAFCPKPARILSPAENINLDLGCSDNQPYNDGVVCEQSATMGWLFAHGPSDLIADPNYAHTKNSLSKFVTFPCDTNQSYLVPLYAPGPDVLSQIEDAVRTALK